MFLTRSHTGHRQSGKAPRFGRGSLLNSYLFLPWGNSAAVFDQTSARFDHVRVGVRLAKTSARFAQTWACFDHIRRGSNCARFSQSTNTRLGSRLGSTEVRLGSTKFWAISNNDNGAGRYVARNGFGQFTCRHVADANGQDRTVTPHAAKAWGCLSNFGRRRPTSGRLRPESARRSPTLEWTTA